MAAIGGFMLNLEEYQEVVRTKFAKELIEFRIHKQDDYVWLDSIAIKNEYRGNGLGSAIIEDLIFMSKTISGIKGIKLMNDRKTRHKLIPFYQTFGFSVVDDAVLNGLMQIEFYEELTSAIESFIADVEEKLCVTFLC